MTPEEQANDIVTRGFDLPPNQRARLRNLIRDSIAAAITDAIAAEREKWIAAGFADEKGEPRKVLGTLPMTADGAYVGDDGNCFFPWRYGNRVVMMKKVRHCGLVCQEGDCVASIGECYSTREAAESARAEAGKEKPANKAVPRQSMIKIGGESFRCSCKCNVFTVIEETADTMRYRCNGCSETYTGEKKQ